MTMLDVTLCFDTHMLRDVVRRPSPGLQRDWLLECLTTEHDYPQSRLTDDDHETLYLLGLNPRDYRVVVVCFASLVPEHCIIDHSAFVEARDLCDNSAVLLQPRLTREFREFTRRVHQEIQRQDQGDTSRGRRGSRPPTRSAMQSRDRDYELEITQREEARLICLAKTFQIDWQAESWKTPARNSQDPPWEYQITEMTDSHLWDTINWLVRNTTPLFELYVPCREQQQLPQTEIGSWLARQPLFRNLLFEAITRKLTFPADVFAYLTQHIIQENAPETIREPWRDPQLKNQSNDFESFMFNEYEQRAGRAARRISFD